MRKDEIVRKNVSLIFDFLRYLTEHPELIEKMPDGCELEFLDKDFPLAELEPSTEGAKKIFLTVEHTFDISVPIPRTLATDVTNGTRNEN